VKILAFFLKTNGIIQFLQKTSSNLRKKIKKIEKIEKN
jgi:hypothetical protein